MTSDRLLDTLASGLTPVRRRSLWRDGLAIGLLAAVELALFLMLGMVRPDMSDAMTEPTFWWKLASFGMIAAVGLATAVRSFDPIASPGAGLRAAAWLGGVALLVGWGIDAAHKGHAPLLTRLEWREGVGCSIAMLLLALPMLAALGVLMRRGASTHQSGSGLAAGLAAASWGAFVFLFRCPHDDPVYVVVWYGFGSVLIGLAARALLPRMARW
jgi:hypothetical protein